jgi:hypothetical protein
VRVDPALLAVASVLNWERLYPGHYTTDDERFEIIHTHKGWEWTERPTGKGGIERTLRNARESCWTGESISGRTTYDADDEED